ncbi:MAG: hypothetical protein FJX76_16620 [Armatimonadetes bacterium]|nr:hypothetical protein [Armatimonadota bacterium]
MKASAPCRFCKTLTPRDELVSVPGRFGRVYCQTCATRDKSGDSGAELYKRRGLTVCEETRPDPDGGGTWRMLR